MPCFYLTWCNIQYSELFSGDREVGGQISLKQWPWFFCSLQGVLVREDRNGEESNGNCEASVRRTNGLTNRPSNDTSRLSNSQVRPTTSPQRCHFATGTNFHLKTPTGGPPLLTTIRSRILLYSQTQYRREARIRGRNVKHFASTQKKMYYSKVTIHFN